MAAIPADFVSIHGKRLGLTPGGLRIDGKDFKGAVPTLGKDFFVHQDGADTSDGRSPNRALATVSAAHAKMTAGKNDICYVLGTGENAGQIGETATITWSKSACHLIGVAAPGVVAQRAKISPEGASVTDVTPVINITGSGCYFDGIHWFQNFATAAGNVAMAMTGQRNVFNRCHIAGGGNATAAAHAGTRSLTIAGDNGEHYFKDCTIGLDTIPRGSAASAEIEITGASTRNMFEDCLILSRTDGADHDQLLIGTSGIDRWVIFKNCIFWNDTVGGGTKADEHLNVVAGAGGIVLLEKTTTFGATAIETVKHGSVYQSIESTSIAAVLS